MKSYQWRFGSVPFRHAKYYVHTNIPSQRTFVTNITMNPLLQVAIIDVVIHKHPNFEAGNPKTLDLSQQVPSEVRIKHAGLFSLPVCTFDAVP